MAGNTNSRGFAVDHEGHCLEDEISDNIAPFAISGDVLAELFSGAGKDTSCSHLEAHPVVGSRGPFPSSSGGIPVADRVTVEEYVSSDEEPLSPHSASELCKNNTSATVHAMMRVSKNERDELLRARRKLGDVLSFLKKHGFSEEQVLKEMVQNEFLKDVPSRDELGLPLSSSAHVVSPGTLNPFVDKMKSKASDLSQSAPVVIGRKVFDEQPKPPIPPAQIPKNAPEIPVEMPHKMQKPETKNEDVPRKSWANVLKKDCPPAPSFNYFPIGDSNIVEPPLDELKKGNDLYKCCMVGTFAKGTVSFKDVSDFAHKMWSVKGLLTVCQKDNHTYVFKFDAVQARDAVLSRGTWYIGKRPMVVTCWGKKPGADTINAIPMCIKLSNVPDSYWTADGLSRLASTVGRPLSADSLTAKLELLPFARMQVLNKLGDPMPTEVQATVLDPTTEEKMVTNVLISYPFRPMFCTGCSSLGHTTGACPRVNRIWVKKSENNVKNDEVPKQSNVKPPSPLEGKSHESDANSPAAPSVGALRNDSGLVKVQDQWSEVKRKKGTSSEISEGSPTPPQTFKNLKNVDEIDRKHPTARLTKSQKKKLKLQQGSPSPPPIL